MPYSEFAPVALQACTAAGHILRGYYRRDVRSEQKADASPVTDADRDSETLIRNHLRQAFPKHGIIGEEFGRDNDTAEFIWVIDPLDGTASFLTGRPLFGVLLGLLHNGKPVLGVLHQPVTGETWLGVLGKPTTLNGIPVTAAASQDFSTLAAATTGAHYLSDRGQRAFAALSTTSRFPLYGGDCYLAAQLASGGLGVLFEEGLAPHDVAALLPIIEGSGGVMTDWEGQPPLPLSSDKHNVLAAANPALHQQALNILATT